MSNVGTGGSIRILWDADDAAEVTITGNNLAAFTVGGSAVTFPYTLNSSTTFKTIHNGTYTVSVKHHGIEVAGTPDGTRTVVLENDTSSVFAPSADSTPTPKFLDELSATFGRRRGYVTDVVKDHGAKVDGATDDTAAWQAAINDVEANGGGTVVCSKAGVSIIAGALQDTAGANAQILLPSIDVGTGKQITVAIEGSVIPPQVFSVIGAMPLPDTHLVLKSTLNAGAGGAVIGGAGPAGSYGGFTNLNFVGRNFTVRLPDNPVLTALNLSKVTATDLDGVTADTGNYNIDSLPDPTTTTSWGFRLPATDNGAYTRLGALAVAGFYNGYQFAEHTVGQQINAWGCKRPFDFGGTNHASHFQRMMASHCQNGIIFTGSHYVTVEQFDIEHAGSGTWAAATDLSDPSNFGGGVIRWHVVKAGVGPDAGFLRDGGNNLTVLRAYGLRTRAYKNTAVQALPGDSSHQAITMDAEDFDTVSAHDNATNNSRISAVVTGWYEALAQASFSTSSTGLRFAAIWKNGVGTGTKIAAIEGPPTGTDSTNMQISSGRVWLVAGDFVELGMATSAAVNANENDNCWLQLVQVG
ncbi:MAG TPA: hypothetical protein VFH56_14395 [Acidimicrobiales bacterium]|nr:hypothetical protein [Acidimicrobiales bacterium]